MTKTPEKLIATKLPNSVAVEINGKLTIVANDSPYYPQIKKAMQLMRCYVRNHLEREE